METSKLLAKGEDNPFKTQVNPDNSLVTEEEKTTKASKKKYIWWGAAGILLLGSIIAVLVIFLTKKQTQDPETIVHYNPYEMQFSD